MKLCMCTAFAIISAEFFAPVNSMNTTHLNLFKQPYENVVYSCSYDSRHYISIAVNGRFRVVTTSQTTSNYR
jgi:hypothetical protein